MDHGDELGDAVGRRLHHVGGFDVQRRAVGKECIGIELCDFHDGLVLPLSALEHFVLAGVGIGGKMAHVGDIHHTLDVIAQIPEIFLQHILHNIAPEVANVSEMIDRRAAGVHFDFSGLVGNQLLLGSSKRII